MKIENPFESGHIKNYVLAYVGVVVIMVLFFIAAQLFNEPKKHSKKVFATQPTQLQKRQEAPEKKAKVRAEEKRVSPIKILEKAY